MLLKKKKLYAIKSKAWGESNLNPFEFGPLHFNLGLYKQQTLKTYLHFHVTSKKQQDPTMRISNTMK
jgi:hypothetical protein